MALGFTNNPPRTPPRLSYDFTLGVWEYQNGCVRRIFKELEPALKKFNEFVKYPQRHIDYWDKNQKCLGVDVPYDAWKEPEETFHVGQIIKCESDCARYVIVRQDGVRNKIRVLLLGFTPCVFASLVDVNDINKITREELDRTASCFLGENLTSCGDLNELYGKE
jgi:hypothetical protein